MREIIITVADNGQISVKGPKDKIFMMGVLEAAKFIIASSVPESNLIVPDKPGDIGL